MSGQNANFNLSEIEQKFDELFADFDTNVYGFLDIVVVGSVSSGKSSFLNAFFNYPRSAPKFQVSSIAGTTGSPQFAAIGDHIRVIDTPGLQDFVKEKSSITEEKISQKVDIGILVIQGCADMMQIENYKLLKRYASHVFIILNKIDRYSEKNLKDNEKQWRMFLNLDNSQSIYWVSSRGYDIDDRIKDPVTGEEREIPVNVDGIPLTLKGIEPVRNAVLEACFESGKSVFLIKEFRHKDRYAIVVIATACIVCSATAYIPGSIAFVASAWATAIASLSYIYRGRYASKDEIREIIGTFVLVNAQSIGTTVYTAIISFLPPNGIFDTIGVLFILPTTAAMLLMVKAYFSAGLTIAKTQKLTKEFLRIKTELARILRSTDVKNLASREYWVSTLQDIDVGEDKHSD